MVVGSLHEDWIHAGREVGEQVPVDTLEDTVFHGDQAAGVLQRDGDDGKSRIQDTRGVVGECLGQWVGQILRNTDAGHRRRRRPSVVDEKGGHDQQRHDGDVEYRHRERHLGSHGRVR